MAESRTRLQPQQRRRQIIDAGRELFAERPYEEIPTREIAERAGVTRGLVHHYFGDKRALFLEVMRESVEMPAAPVPAMDGLDLAGRARAVMDWILDAAATYGQAWVNASGSADLHGTSDVQAVLDEADDRAARLVLDALGLPDDAHLRARLRPVAALTKSACREWLQHGNLTRAEVLDLLTDTVLRFVELGDTEGGE